MRNAAVKKLALSACLWTFGAGAFAQAPATMPFQNPDLPTAQRVDDLVGRMTLPEKVRQMQTDAPAIERLGVPEYHWWSESLHGTAVSPATVFPQAIGLAATWNTDLHSQVATAIGDEDRATYNVTVARTGHAEGFHGLTYFAPNINIFRDPRWGRGQETYGEDPYLTGRFGVAYIQGLQGNDPQYFKVVATAKHYAVHSGPEPERHRFDAVVSEYDLFDTYLPAFEAAVRQGHVDSVMGAYSSLDGVPDCANPRLLDTILRKDWGFDGYVVSDCGAIGDISGGHHYAPTNEAGSALAVKAGCDITCGGEYVALEKSVAQGLITEAQIDTSVKRLFTARMRLGMFDPPARVPYSKLGAADIESQKHQQLALQAARESLVLLKNDRNTLPFGNAIRHIAVIGPNADAVGVQRGNYNGTSAHEVSVLTGLKQRAPQGVTVEYVEGVGLTTLSDLSTVPSDALRSGGKPGLHGEYFNNETLQGPPVATRQDAQIAFHFSGNGPVAGLTQFHYSARWTGELIASRDGEYTLGVRGDDGFRLFVNDQKVIDDWGVHPAETKTTTLTLKAGQAVPIQLEYYQGVGDAEISLLWKQPGQAQFEDALAAARRADAVVFVGGISAQLEGEEGTNGNGDRTTLDIPQVQQDLLQAVAGVGKPVVVVLMNGSALSVNWAQAHVPAILESWYPGEAGGTAVAEALFGDYNPAGRLPVTFYKSTDQLPPFRDYAMKGRTYRYFMGEP
nr:glycoside hydrolase family 3 C-terminal domain-containing protein [Armatimonadota bacterium]